MSANKHRTHSIGLNDVRRNKIISATESGDGYEFDYAIRSVPGSMMSVRQGARALITEYLRSGNELPLPLLTRPETAMDISQHSLAVGNATAGLTVELRE